MSQVLYRYWICLVWFRGKFRLTTRLLNYLMTLKVLCMIDSLFSIKDEETRNIQRNAWNETDYGIVILTEFWEIRFKCKIINIDSPWDSFTTFFFIQRSWIVESAICIKISIFIFNILLQLYRCTLIWSTLTYIYIGQTWVIWKTCWTKDTKLD